MTMRSLVAVACLAIVHVPMAAQQKTESGVPTMPGRLVATDAGHKLHLWCTGEGSPTVILLTGGGSFSIDWADVQPAIAPNTRVCSYDRAGYAWSDPGPAPRGLGTSAAELHQVLARAGVRPPYLLVGSSWGGLIARVFAHAHSDEVAGVVLVDAPTWGTRSSGTAVVSNDLLMDLDPRADEEPTAPPRLPSEWQAARAWAKSRLPEQVLTLEYTDLKEPDLTISATTAGNRVSLGDIPLVVISGGRVSWDAATRANSQSYAAAQREHIADQARLTGLSRNSKFIVARASFHAVQFYEPEVITNAVLQMLGSARAGGK
jgi:pimeloyl-ACP methyl ester carboxylesterase